MGRSRSEAGQASLLLGLLAALLAGATVLFALGQAYGAKGMHQRAADLAAVSGAQVMRRHYPRLFEPAFFGDGVPNPRHLSTDTYLSLARVAALRGASRNGVRADQVRVGFPDAGFAPTRSASPCAAMRTFGWRPATGRGGSRSAHTPPPS